MLVVIVLPRLGEAHRGQARLIEGIVIAAAAITIDAENHANRRLAIDFFDGARQFARRAIAVINFAVAGKQTHTMRRAWAQIVADDVVVEHPADGITLLLQPLDHVRRAEESLLFAGNGCEDQRRAKTLAARGD